MIKKIYTGIYLLGLLAIVNNYSSEAQADSSVPNFTRPSENNSTDETIDNSNGTTRVRIGSAVFNEARINNTKNEKVYYVRHKAYEDTDSTFAQKVAGTLINGSWEGLEALPGRIMVQISDLALQFALKRFVDWFNNMPSDTPTAKELTIVGLTRDMGVLEAQLELNTKDLKRLMADKKRAEESQDTKELESIEETVQELREIRKELNSQLRILMIKNKAA